MPEAGNGLRQAGHEEERRECEDREEQKKRQEGPERQERRGKNLGEIERDADEEKAGERRRRADLRGREGLPVGEGKIQASLTALMKPRHIPIASQ